MTFLVPRESVIIDSFKTNTDIANRLRVSEPLIGYNSEFTFDKGTERWGEQITGSGSATHQPNIKGVSMDTTTASGDRVVRQTNEYFRHQSGIPSTITAAFLFSPGETGNVKRVGYFDDSDGLFVQQDGTAVSLVTRSSTSGSPVDTPTPQNEWNLDPLDGSGESEITLDFTKIQNIIISFEWYGASVVRYGFKLHNTIYWAHTVSSNNNFDVPLIGESNLPIRYEIENTGATTTPNKLTQYVSTLIRDAGSDSIKGEERTVNRGTNLATVSTETPLISLRLKQGFHDAQVILLSFNIASASNALILWEFISNGTLTGASWVNASKATEKDISATDVTNGDTVYSGYAAGTSQLTFDFTEILRLGSNINGEADVITIRASTTGNNVDMACSINFKELY